MKKPEVILCLDIDGTLINDQEQVHPEDIKVLTNFPETIQLVLTTGRPLGSAKGVLHANNLYQDMTLPIPGVFMNGTAAYLPEEKLQEQHHFSENIRQELIKLAEKFKSSTFAFFTLTHVHLINPTQFSLDVSKKHYLSFFESNPVEIPNKINKMMVIEADKDKLRLIKEHAIGIKAEIAYSLPYLLEFSPKGINKPAALKALLTKLNLDGQPIYAVGDGQNDLALFELAKINFAPSSAQQNIRNKADHIIQREQNGILSPVLETINKEIL